MPNPTQPRPETEPESTTLPEDSSNDLGLPLGIEAPREDTPPSIEQVEMERLQARLNKPSKRQTAKDGTAKAGQVVEALEGMQIDNPTMARIVGQLQEQISDLKGQLNNVAQGQASQQDGTMDLGPAGFPWQYYRRPDRGLQAGWVIAAPGGATPSGKRSSGKFVRYMAKGMKPITAYGNCQPPSAYRDGGQQMVPMLRAGGAREFPAAQVLAHKWHIRPPLPGTVFPEYEKVKDHVRHFECDDCDFDIWMLEDDKETGMACFRHLRKDSGDGRHNYGRREATAILKEFGLPFSAGRYAALTEDIKRAELGDSEAVVKAAEKLQETE